LTSRPGDAASYLSGRVLEEYKIFFTTSVI